MIYNIDFKILKIIIYFYNTHPSNLPKPNPLEPIILSSPIFQSLILFKSAYYVKIRKSIDMTKWGFVVQRIDEIITFHFVQSA